MEMTAASFNQRNQEKGPFYPISSAHDSYHCAEGFADEIQRRMAAGSPLLLLGDGNGLAAILQKRGIHHDNSVSTEWNGRFFLLLEPENTEDAYIENAKVVNKTWMTLIIESYQNSGDKKHPLLVCLNSPDMLSPEDVAYLMHEQRHRNIEMVITDDKAFMVLPHDVQACYLDNVLSADWHYYV